jgi:hypothetical protein
MRAEGLSILVLVLHFASTFYMVGLVWFVQRVHYPLFAGVGSQQFPAYERAHVTRTNPVVGPAMLMEAATALALVVLPMPTSSGSRPRCSRFRATATCRRDSRPPHIDASSPRTGSARPHGRCAACSCSGWSQARGLEPRREVQEGFVRQVPGWRKFVHHVHDTTDGFRLPPDETQPQRASSRGDADISLW